MFTGLRKPKGIPPIFKSQKDREEEGIDSKPKTGKGSGKGGARPNTGGAREGAGTKPKEFDSDQFEKLCGLQCTQDEICSILRLDNETLKRKVENCYSGDYPDVYRQFSSNGKCSLRRNQFILSKTNASIAIWLGKNWLGQKDSSQENAVTPEMAAQFVAYMDALKQAQICHETDLNTSPISDNNNL